MQLSRWRPPVPWRWRAAARRWAPRVRWLRFVLAIGLLAAAALVAGRPADSPAAMPRPDDVLVLVAAQDLAAGQTLLDADVTTAPWPRSGVPPGSLGADADVDGRVLAVGLVTGQPVPSAALVGPGLSAGLAPGERAVPVRLADAGVPALLRAGDRIDLYAVAAGGVSAAPGDAVLVLAGAVVLAVPTSTDGAVPDGALVLLAVPVDLVSRVLAATYTAVLAASLSPP